MSALTEELPFTISRAMAKRCGVGDKVRLQWRPTEVEVELVPTGGEPPHMMVALGHRLGGQLSEAVRVGRDGRASIPTQRPACSSPALLELLIFEV